MKRKFIYISLMIMVASAFQGCKKDFLEIEPKANLLDANFYKTETDAFEAVTAVYDAFSVQNWAIVPMMSDIWSDDEYKGGSAASDMQEWGNYEFQKASPEDANTAVNLWNRCYSGIYRANTYLSKQEGIIWTTPANKTRFEAESRFLRAYFYWDLVRHYGWVPIILTPDPNVENYKTLKQNTPSEVYMQIASDLLYAINNLPATALPSTQYGRATKYAAEALLARIYLFYTGFAQNTTELQVTGAWSDGTTTIDKAFVQTAVDDIIAQNQYQLLTSYSQLFDWAHQNSSEAIFEWQYSALGKSSDWTGWNIDGDFMVIFCGVRTPVGDASIQAGWSFGTLTWSLANEFEAGDPRKDVTVYDAGKKLTSYQHAYQNTGYFNAKFLPRTAYLATSGESTHNYAKNFPDIRLADVLLMGAELYLSDNPTKALGYLNQVRTRSLGTSAALGSISLAAIKHERRVELACEGSRKWDLMRWGMAEAKVLIDKTFDPLQLPSDIERIDDFPTTGYLEVKYLGMLPIPGSEIRKSSVLEQKIAAYKTAQ